MPFIYHACRDTADVRPEFARTRVTKGLAIVLVYPGDRNYSCTRQGFFWHTGLMFSASAGVAVRAHIALDVFLRLTRMDVCCGPPALNW